MVWIGSAIYGDSNKPATLFVCKTMCVDRCQEQSLFINDDV